MAKLLSQWVSLSFGHTMKQNHLWPHIKVISRFQDAIQYDTRCHPATMIASDLQLVKT
jgi:hypothetical protein